MDTRSSGEMLVQAEKEILEGPGSVIDDRGKRYCVEDNDSSSGRVGNSGSEYVLVKIKYQKK